jgi:hypothetical protein
MGTVENTLMSGFVHRNRVTGVPNRLAAADLAKLSLDLCLQFLALRVSVVAKVWNSLELLALSIDTRESERVWHRRPIDDLSAVAVYLHAW